MPTTIEKADVLLNDALSALRQEEAEVDSMKQAIQARIAAIESAMSGTPVAVSRRSTGSVASDLDLSISDQKLNEMIDYMRKHPKARQSDIAKDTGFNSGTISIGLRKLKAMGAVQEAGRENGSRLWEFLRVPAHA